jgi:DNA-binding response OmpR family regulator
LGSPTSTHVEPRIAEGLDRPILIVDDDNEVRETIRAHLERSGFVVREATGGEDAVQRVFEHMPALVVMDVTLRDTSGLQVCRRLRAAEETRGLPIIMLTARKSEVDRVVGLELGADDYVTKPFSPKELVARVRALLRRAAPRAPQQPSADLRCGRLHMNLGSHEVSIDGRSVVLTLREFELLRFFVQHADKVFSRAQLLAAVWPRRMDERSVDVHVRRLRRRLEQAGVESQVIVTVRGVGYRFDAGRLKDR